MIAFLLDEMYSQITSGLVRRDEIDIVSIHELRREGIRDPRVLAIAAEMGRCVITDNHRDFVPLTLQFQEQGLPHAGVLLVPSRVGHDAFALLARAIVRFARENPNGLQPYEIRWLHVDLE